MKVKYQAYVEKVATGEAWICGHDHRTESSATECARGIFAYHKKIGDDEGKVYGYTENRDKENGVAVF